LATREEAPTKKLKRDVALELVCVEFRWKDGTVDWIAARVKLAPPCRISPFLLSVPTAADALDKSTITPAAADNKT
jgi:hypothetical protein